MIMQNLMLDEMQVARLMIRYLFLTLKEIRILNMK
jgi:hypothetical protein